jgi:hypothetical protein
MSQDGSTVYPFSGKQVRTMAQVKLAYENILDQNKTLLEMTQWCDSVRETQANIIVQMDDLIVIKDEQIINKNTQIVLEREKFGLADEQTRKERKLKWVFMGTTILMAGFLTLSLL